MANQSRVHSVNTGVYTSPVLIIGIDPGTTSFKVAVLIVEEIFKENGTSQLIQAANAYIAVLADFPGDHRVELPYASTSLMYDSHDFKLSKWGHLATHFQKKNNFDPKYLVNHWKLGIHKSSSPAARRLQEALQAAAVRLNKRPESFIEDFFVALRSYLFECPNSNLLSFVNTPLSYFKHIDIVLAVPPGWPRHEHRIFSHAATMGLGKIPNLRVCTVSETECILRSWSLVPKNQSWIKVGDIIILLDLGGGTACISGFYYETTADGERRWAHIESYSLSAGSEIVTEEFIKDVQDRLRGVKELSNISQILHRARLAFEEKKKEVGEEEDDEYWGLLVEGLKPNIHKGFGENKMYFTKERLESYFAPSQDLIFAKIHEVSHRLTLTHGKPRGCIVAGAYGKNILFRKRFEKENTLGMEIFYPNPIPEQVVRGACLARLQGDFRQFSGSRYSIGIKVYISWEKAKKACPAAHRQKYYSRKFDGDDKDYYPAISWPIKKGDAVDIDQEVHDSLTIRYFEPDEEIQFTDTIFISESHPGSARYSVLKYKTTDPLMWKYNRRDLRERNIFVEATEVTWSINQTDDWKVDGSRGPYNRLALPEDPKDDRVIKRRFLQYKFYIRPTQTDCEISVEAFFEKQKTQKMVVKTTPLIVLDGGEYGSIALPEEYDNLSNRHEDGEEFANFSKISCDSQQLKGVKRRKVQRPTSYTEDIRIRDANIDQYPSQSPPPTSSLFGKGLSSSQVSKRSTEVASPIKTRSGAKKKRFEAPRPKKAVQTRITARQLREMAMAAGEIMHPNLLTLDTEVDQNPGSVSQGYPKRISPTRLTNMSRNPTSQTPISLSNQNENMPNAASFESDDSSGEYNPRAKKSRRRR